MARDQHRGGTYVHAPGQALNRLAFIRRVLADSQLRRVEFGIVAFSMSENGTWLAITVFAYQRGGVREAGIVAFIQLVPAALIAPFLAFAADRFRRDKVLAAGFVVQAVAFGLTAFAMWGGLPPAIVYLAAMSSAVAETVTRPSAAAVLPSLADSPSSLTAANVVASLAEQTGMFLGPAGAGFLLATSSPASVFMVASVLMALTAAMTTSLQLRPTAADASGDETVTASLVELSAGIGLVVRDKRTRMLVGLMVLIFMVVGALDVAFVAIAIDLVHRSEATAGLFATALGFGGAIGAAASVGLVGRRRLTWPLAFGVFAGGVAVAAMAFSPPVAVLVVLFAINGSGSAIADIAGRTMLQGMSPDDVLARVFGVLESLTMAALAAGSLIFSLLTVAVGIEGALAIIGLILPLALVLRLPQLLAIDAARPLVDPTLLRLVRDVPIFAPLPAYTVEQLIVNFVPGGHPADSELIRRGDPGSRFFLVTGGTAQVEVSDGSWLSLGPGQYFGEIALLRDAPRNANVRSGPDGLKVLTLERDVFLAAVTGHPRSLSRVETEARNRHGGTAGPRPGRHGPNHEDDQRC